MTHQDDDQVVSSGDTRMVIDLPVPIETYAEAVHRAVCGYTGHNGKLSCPTYAIFGKYLFNETRKWHNLGRCIILTGNRALNVDIHDKSLWYGYNPKTLSLDNGCFQTFLGFPDTGVIADFAIRHAGPIDGFRVWRRPPPPTCVVATIPDVPEWIEYTIDEDMTAEHNRRIGASRFREVVEPLVLCHFVRLLTGD